VQTGAVPDEILAGMQQPGSAEEHARRRFVEAVIAFAADPGPDNLERYFAASRSLEESRRRPKVKKQLRPQLQGAANR
jgi:hypothetical protein